MDRTTDQQGINEMNKYFNFLTEMNPPTKFFNLLKNEELICPMCKGKKLTARELGISGTLWKIMFGRGYFTKKDLVGFACEDCGHIFFMVGDAVGVKDGE